jgi:hypothetical protein
MTPVTTTPRPAAQRQQARRRKVLTWVAASSTAAFATLAGFLGGQLAAGNDPALGARVQDPPASRGVSELPSPLVTKTS